MATTNKIITRQYAGFRGVDFTNGLVSRYRSPDSINMWKNYLDDDCIQTRPGMELIGEFDGEIFGLFFYKLNNTTHVLVHSGNKLYKWNNFPSRPVQTTLLASNMALMKSNYFVFDDILFIMDGVNYYEYDGTNLTSVVGTIPMTTYVMTPQGQTDLDEGLDTDKMFQPLNCLTGVQQNQYEGDGTSVDYVLANKGLDANYSVFATVDNVRIEEGSGLTVNRNDGIVTFSTAPTSGARVIIQFSKTESGMRDRILNCRIVKEFDNRIFFSGNPDYPNGVFYCEASDPRYIRENAWVSIGLDLAPVKAVIPGNNALWVVKDTYQNSASVYYMTRSVENGTDIYPSNPGNIALGCISTGINFNDDIVFFSKLGLEGFASTSLYSEQVLQHRSNMIDSKMVNETHYDKVRLAEWSGYLLCVIDSHVYLADKRQKFLENTDVGYEWFYWELPVKEVAVEETTTKYPINDVFEFRGKLYFSNAYGQVYQLKGTTDNGEDINSYWTTCKDDFDAPSYTKTTSKKGGVLSLKKMDNDEIEITSILDGEEKKTKEVVDTKGYCVYKVKNKKFKEIQFKIGSDKPFGLFNMTIQGFIAGYVKRWFKWLWV